MEPLSTGVPLADRYLLIERLGAGGMSVVWRGYDDVLGRPVAVKVLASPIAADPVFREVIQREARAAAKLAHPNVMHVYDYGEAQLPDGHTVPYVVMELIDGDSLIDRLRQGPLPWREAVRMAAQVADALAAAHRRGIVHRDIAPANIMLTGTGAKVLDFGIAALAGGRGDPEGGTLLGTPAYVAPERLDDAPAAPAADVYALGALLYESLTGTPPLPARTWQALADAYREGVSIEPLHVDGLPDAVAAICERCLAKDPAFRPGAADVSRALTAALTDPAPSPDPASPAGARVPTGAPLTKTAVMGDPARRVEPGPTRAVAEAPGLADAETVPLGKRKVPVPRLAFAGGLVLAAAALITVVALNGNHSGTGPPGLALPASTSARPTTSPTDIGLPPPSPSASSVPPTHRPSGTPKATATQTASQVVQTLLNQVEAGRQAGQIHPDVAVDLENILHNLQQTLARNQPVDLTAQASLIRTKISDRQREGGIADALANQLLTTVDGLVSM